MLVENDSGKMQWKNDVEKMGNEKIIMFDCLITCPQILWICWFQQFGNYGKYRTLQSDIWALRQVLTHTITANYT